MLNLIIFVKFYLFNRSITWIDNLLMKFIKKFSVFSYFQFSFIHVFRWFNIIKTKLIKKNLNLHFEKHQYEMHWTYIWMYEKFYLLNKKKFLLKIIIWKCLDSQLEFWIFPFENSCLNYQIHESLSDSIEISWVSECDWVQRDFI